MLVRLLTRFAICLFGIALVGCAEQPVKAPMTPLQIQAIQTQQFDANTRAAFNAVMLTLQNNGYTVQSANFKTGFITAKSPTRGQPFIGSDGLYNSGNADDASDAFVINEQTALRLGLAIGFAAMGGGGAFYAGEGSNEEHHVYAVTFTAYITPVEQAKHTTTQIRLSFVQNETIVGNGTVTHDTQILDPNFYTNIFSQIRQQIFVSGAINY